MKTLALLSGAASVTLAMPAAAQTPADQATSAEADTAADDVIVSGRYTLPDQIDTATGLGLTVRETPQSISIITEQRILDQNFQSLVDVVTNGVGVSTNEIDDVRNSFFARGFEIQNYQVDGVPLAWSLAGSAGETMADPALYERIEIVRGPTGLLTGAGDPSASINLVRKHATGTALAGYIDVGAGRWNTWRVQADLGGAVTSDGRLRVRGVAKYEQGDSYIDIYSNRKLVLYGTLEADVTDSTLLRVGMSHQQGRPDGPLWGALPSFYSDGSFAAYPRSKSSAADWTFWDTTNQNFYASVRQDFGGGWQAVVNYNRLRNTQHTNILYLYGTVDRTTGLGLASNPFSDRGESIQNSIDGRLNGTVNLFGRDHEVVFGALRSVQNREGNTFAALNLGPSGFPPAGNFLNWTGTSYPFPGFSETPTLSVSEKVKQTGYYGSLRLNLSDSLKLIGGGRLASYSVSGFNYGPPRTYGDDDVFIPYVGALYDLTPDHRVYASFTKIFQPQNAVDRNFDYLPPLDGKQYEIGIKSAFFDEALQVSAALFRIEQDNLAQADIVVIRPGQTLPTQTYRAVQGTVSEGYEIEVTGQPLPGWNINLGFSDFKAEDSNGADVSTDQPRRLLKLFTTYRLPGALERVTIGGGMNYRSRNYSDGTNPVTQAPFRFQQDGYALVSLMGRVDLTDRLQVQANVENLTDKTYFSQVGFFSQYRYGAPRNVNVSAHYRF